MPPQLTALLPVQGRFLGLQFGNQTGDPVERLLIEHPACYLPKLINLDIDLVTPTAHEAARISREFSWNLRAHS
jgi:hypothetical protein